MNHSLLIFKIEPKTHLFPTLAWASSFPGIFLGLLLLLTPAAFSQKRVSANVEIKQVAKGKSITFKKNIYYQSSGKLVVHFTQPQEYYMLTNTQGEARIYMPKTNEVMRSQNQMYSSQN